MVKKKTMKKSAKKKVKDVKKKSSKETTRKTAVKKKTVAKKKTASKTAVKKKTGAKKTAPGTKKAAVKKKTVTKKKSAVKKKTVARKKAPITKKTAAKKKTVTKKTAAKKKPVVKKKTVSAKKTVVAKQLKETQRTMPDIRKETVYTPGAVESKVTLMVVDPYKLFMFWDIDENELNSIVSNGEGYITVLRVYIYEGDTQSGFFDIKTEQLSDEIYLDVIPNRGYNVHFGVMKGSTFISLASSRTKFTPAFGIEDEDMTPEIYEMLIEQIPSWEERISS